MGLLYRILVIFSLVVAPVSLMMAQEVSTGGLKGLKSAGQNDADSIALYLSSPDAQERGHAAERLGRLGNAAQSATKLLLESLTDYGVYREENETQIVSVKAAQALRQIDPKISIPAKLLTRVSRAAAAPAERRVVRGGWVARCASQPEALLTLSAMVPLTPSALPEIVRLNRKTCTENRALPVALMVDSAVAAEQTPQLIPLLSDPDVDVRLSAAEYMGEARLKGATSALGRALNDEKFEVRLAALTALEKIHPEGEGRIPLLKPLLSAESPEIRRQAMRLLLQLAPEGAPTVSLLHERLKDPNPSVAIESAQALARLSPRSPVLKETLIRLATEGDLETGLEAAALLKASGSRDPKVKEALAPYQERERSRQIEQALITSTAQERATNAKTLRINGIRIAKNVMDEQPDQEGKVFGKAVKRLFCWTSVSVGTAPTALRHEWYWEGKPVYEAKLVSVSASDQVWSSYRVKPGKWRVDIMAPDNRQPLASTSFTILPK